MWQFTRDVEFHNETRAQGGNEGKEGVLKPPHNMKRLRRATRHGAASWQFFGAELAILRSVCTACFQNQSPAMASCTRCAFQGACGKESHAIWRRPGNSKQFCWSRGCRRENSYHKKCGTPTFTTKPGNFTTIQCLEWLEKPNVGTHKYVYLCNLSIGPDGLRVRARKYGGLNSAEAKTLSPWASGPRTLPAQCGWKTADLRLFSHL